MSNPFLQIPRPELHTKAEAVILHRLRVNSEALLLAYREKNLQKDVLYIARDAAKRLFPEYLANPTLHNRDSDRAASAIADAVRLTALSVPPRKPRSTFVVVTGTPASGKTVASRSVQTPDVEIVYETILTNWERADQIVLQALLAHRRVLLHLIYTDDPRIHVRRMVERARRIKRTVPLQFAATTYVSLPAIAAKLKEKYQDALAIIATDNSRTPELARTYNDLSRVCQLAERYTTSKCLEEMDEELDAIHAKEAIPDAILSEARRR